jgi:uncharacterized glyoxalase superfamily protein PhnB
MTERAVPESLRLGAVSPSLTVGDLDASLEWYRQVGFTVEELWEREGQVRGAVLVAGVGRLMLAQDDGAKGRDRVKGQGVRLYLTTTQDVDQVAASIKERGGELESEPADMPWGARAFTLVDPDGFLLTIADG